MTMIFASDDCLRICTLEYNPFCATQPGSDEKRTFANPCEMETYNCENKSSEYAMMANGYFMIFC